MASVPGVGPVEAAEARVSAALTGRFTGPARLLLVEDDAGDALLVEEYLADSGLRTSVNWVKSLSQAQPSLTGPEAPDCVLLDLHLPDAQGLDGLREVLAAAPRTPVIVLTGLAEDQTGVAALAEGAQDYLVKGRLEPHRLEQAIRYAVQRKQVELTAAELQVGRLRAEENRRLERGLLPRPLIHGDDVSVVCRYRPGRQHSLLGGDFYDVVRTQDGAVHAVIGDVAGHGPAEAALGVCLRVAWRSFVMAGVTGPRLLQLLEDLLLAERDGHETFVTLTDLTLTPDRSTALVLRAGHPGLLVREGGTNQVRLLEPPVGTALGIFPGLADWEETALPLPPDAGLVLFTDGMFEAQTGPNRQRLDLDGLVGLANAAADPDPERFVDELIGSVEAAAADYGGLGDDAALLHLKWRA